ncbi:serum opacification factor [Streptococcus dysgalactiae]|uniref:serum opacification factor n=1 Tax=Streptococcus dysgalactiae TaxID=1334 RepID=UPI003FD87A30
MTNCKYKLRKLSVGLVSVGTMFMATTVYGSETAPAAPAPAVVAASTASNGGSDGQAQQQPQQLQEQTQSTVVQVQATVSGRSLAVRKEENNTETFETRVPSRQDLPEKNQSNGQNVEIGEDSYTVDIDTTTVEGRISETTVKDDKKLIRNRENSATELFDVKREVKVNEDGKTFDVTVTVTPKEIDKGAEVIVLLDTSKKMTEEQFNNAKEGITQLVETLTGEKNEEKNRNSVRLITFDNTVEEAVELKTKDDVEEKVKKAREETSKNYNYAVNLQAAIHKAREIFGSDNEKNSGKHQHIVLFSQGEATLSYDFNKEKVEEKEIEGGKVTTTNPLFPWPFNFDYTNRKANMATDISSILKKLKSVGIEDRYNIENIIKLANGVNEGIGNLTNLLFGTKTKLVDLDYLKLKEYDTSALSNFDYNKQVGRGYHNHTFYTRKVADNPAKKTIMTAANLKKVSLPDYLGYDFLNKAANTLKDKLIEFVLDYVFYERTYTYYNHNLSAQAEAKMARDEGITFFSFGLNNKDKKSNSNKFEKYLKAMSEGGKELLKKEDINKDKFKYVLDNLEIKEEFSDKLKVKSWKTSLDGEKGAVSAGEVKHNPANGGSWLFTTKENLTWKISKEQFLDAYKNDKPLTLKYTLEWNKKETKNTRMKRAPETPKVLSETKSTGKISSNISYNINGKKGNGSSKLSDVTVTHTKKVVEDTVTKEQIRKEREYVQQKQLEDQMIKQMRLNDHKTWFQRLKDGIQDQWSNLKSWWKGS